VANGVKTWGRCEEPKDKKREQGGGKKKTEEKWRGAAAFTVQADLASEVGKTA